VNVLYYSYRILFIAVSIKNIVDMSDSFRKNTTVEQLNLSVASWRSTFLQCISGNGEVVTKVLEVGKLSKFFAIIHFFSAVI